jgi:glycosyltransferase involved in cell wall biosynthesis
MNILFINSIQMFGGGEIWMLRTLTALQKRGHTVHLLCRPGTMLAQRSRAACISTHTMPIKGDLGPVTIWRTKRLLQKLGIEIILTNMDKELRFAGLAAKWAGGVPLVSRRGIDYPLKDRLHYRLSYNWLATMVVANSQATKDSLLRYAPWLSPDRVKVIYNGIDPEPFMEPTALDLRRQLGLDRESKLIGFVGQLDERKGWHTLLPAFVQTARRHANAHLVAVGVGSLQEWIKHYAVEQGIADRVHLLGFRDDIVDIMKNIDMLILPSLWEGFGIVMVEAMAAAKPVIVTNVSSMPEVVVEGQTGHVVPVRDPAALAKAMLRLLEDQALAQRMGLAGQQRVLEHFTMNHMVDQYESLLNCLRKSI